MDVDFRLAQRHDALPIARMSRDLIETGLGWSYPPDRICRLLDDAEIASVVARRNEQLAGFGIMRIGEERAHLLLLAVRPAFQRHGVGRRVVAWLLDSAIVAGVASVHVELRAQNKAALAFYRAAGFSETMRLSGYYNGRETAIRMLRLLRVPQAAPAPWQPPK